MTPKSLIKAVKRVRLRDGQGPNRLEHLQLAEGYLLDYYDLVDKDPVYVERDVIDLKLRLATIHAILGTRP